MKQLFILIGIASSLAWTLTRVVMVKAMQHPVVALVTIVAFVVYQIGKP